MLKATATRGGAGLVALTGLSLAGAVQAQEVTDLHPERGLVPTQSVSVLERPHPEWDPVGIRVGSLVGNAELGTTAGYTTNEQGFSGGSDDEFLILSPSFGLQSDWTRNSISVQGRSDSAFFANSAKDDTTAYTLQGNGRYDFARGTSLDGGVAFSHVVISRDFVDSPRDLIHPKQYDRQDAGAQLKTTAGPLLLSADIRYIRRDYSAQAGLTQIYDFNLQDSNTFYSDFTAAYPLTPRLGIYGTYTAQIRRYTEKDPLIDRNFNGNSFLAGVVYESPAFLRADVAFGYQTYDYKGIDSGKGANGLRFDASVEWFATELDTVTLTGNRSSDVSEILASPGRTTTNASLRLDHELLRNVIVSGALTTRFDEYDVINRNDRYAGVTATVSYKLNRRFELDAEASYLSVDTDRIALAGGFDDARLFTTLVIHY